MSADYIIKLLAGCEALSGFLISADYSPKENRSVCVMPCGFETTERGYCDGSSVKVCEFELVLRLSADRDKSLENRRLLEEIEKGLEAYGSYVPFPCTADAQLPLRIIISEKPALLADDIHSVRYKMKIKVRYYKGKELI